MHERRRIDTIHAPVTLAVLTREFNARNKELLVDITSKGVVSKSWIYNHMAPVRWTSMEGQRHKRGAVLKAKRAQFNHHEYHPDTKFCRAQIYMAEDFVRMLPDKCAVLSLDEKAKIPLGLPALSKTTKQVMNLHEPIQLSDHTFSKGAKQSIEPTVCCSVNYDPRVSPFVVFFSTNYTLRCLVRYNMCRQNCGARRPMEPPHRRGMWTWWRSSPPISLSQQSKTQQQESSNLCW